MALAGDWLFCSRRGEHRITTRQLSVLEQDMRATKYMGIGSRYLDYLLVRPLSWDARFLGIHILSSLGPHLRRSHTLDLPHSRHTPLTGTDPFFVLQGPASRALLSCDPKITNLAVTK
jgi:hypothetical protein